MHGYATLAALCHMVLAGDDISMDDAFLCGPFFSLHGPPIHNSQRVLPLGRILGFAAYPLLNPLHPGLGAPRLHSLQMVFSSSWRDGWSSPLCKAHNHF